MTDIEYNKFVAGQMGIDIDKAETKCILPAISNCPHEEKHARKDECPLHCTLLVPDIPNYLTEGPHRAEILKKIEEQGLRNE